MTLDVKKYAACAQVEAALKSQMQATGSKVMPESLQGCIQAMTWIAQQLKASEDDIMQLVRQETAAWVSFEETKALIHANRKKKQGK